jgi:hypothetical protein
MRSSARALLSLFILVAFAPVPARAQVMEELLAGIQRGGGWVSVPIENGEGEFQSGLLPTMAVKFSGCMSIWDGHSGGWQITAWDALGDARLEATVQPGEPVLFTYAAGMRSQLNASFRWSEPRDTTLHLWIGLERPERQGEEACNPLTGGSGP